MEKHKENENFKLNVNEKTVYQNVGYSKSTVEGDILIFKRY